MDDDILLNGCVMTWANDDGKTTIKFEFLTMHWITI